MSELEPGVYFAEDGSVMNADEAAQYNSSIVKLTGSESQPNILRYFKYDHLSPRLQEVSLPFSELAHRLDLILPNGPEKSVALRKLLEGKDAAVRSALDI